MHSRWTWFLAVLALVGNACAAPLTREEGGHTLEAQGIGEAEARTIAERTGRDGGYDTALYRVVSIKRVDDDGKSQWAVFFEHLPPTPPGGHFTVYVDARTRDVRLRHGE